MKVFGILKPFFQKGLKRVKGSALAGFGRLSPAGACLGVPTTDEKKRGPCIPSGMLSRMSRSQADGRAAEADAILARRERKT